MTFLGRPFALPFPWASQYQVKVLFHKSIIHTKCTSGNIIISGTMMQTSNWKREKSCLKMCCLHLPSCPIAGDMWATCVFQEFSPKTRYQRTKFQRKISRLSSSNVICLDSRCRCRCRYILCIKIMFRRFSPEQRWRTRIVPGCRKYCLTRIIHLQTMVST